MKDKNIFFRHFPPPVFLEMPSVGVDISPMSMRFMEIIEHPTLKVGKYAEQALSKPFSITNEDQSEVKEILKKWKKEFNLEFVKVSLPEEKAYLFKTEVEGATEAAMRSAIEFTLEENVPLSGAEAIFDYRIIGKSIEKPGSLNTAVTVFPRDVINAYLELFQTSGLTPVSFLIEAQAISRAIVKRGDMCTYLIVNINDTKTGVFIVSKGAVQFTSTIMIGSMDFTKALQKQFDITVAEAEKLKQTKGFMRTADNETLGALISTASVFRQEIEKVYVYWNKHRSSTDPTESIQKILLSGKETLTLGFKEYLTQTLKIPAESSDPWANMNPLDEYIPPVPLSSALVYTAAIGLALPENE